MVRHSEEEHTFDDEALGCSRFAVVSKFSQWEVCVSVIGDADNVGIKNVCAVCCSLLCGVLFVSVNWKKCRCAENAFFRPFFCLLQHPW